MFFPILLTSLLALTASAVSAQAQATATPTPDSITDGCLTIQSDWPVCAGLKGLQLDTQVQGSFLGLAFARSNASDTRPLSAVFASNFRDFLDLQTPRMPNNVNLTYIQTFKDRYGCPNYTHHHRRYLISMWCVDSVFASTRCAANSARRPLCRETCNTYAESSIESFSNSTQCPPQAATSARTNGATEIRAFCDREMFNGREPNCISGREIESPTCGYLLSSRFCDPNTCPEATRFCADRFGIRAATTLPAGGPEATKSATADGQSQAADAGTPAPIVPIILGSTLALLVVIVGAMYFWRWRVDKRRRERYMEGFSNRPTPGGANSSVKPSEPSWIQEENPPPMPPMAQAGPAAGQGGYANLPPQSPSPYAQQQQQQQQQQQPAQLGNNQGQGQQDSQQYGAYWMVNNAGGAGAQGQQQQQQQPRDNFTQPQQSPYSPNNPMSGYPAQQQQQQSQYAQSNVGSNVSTTRANKRISSMIVDKNVTLTELLRASLALDDSHQHQHDSLDKNLPAIPMLPANGTAGPPVTEYDRPVQHRAVRNYAPLMEDELELLVGDVVAVSQQYDDGWGFGLNLATGQVGVLPLGFVAPVDSELDVGKVQARQSIYGDPDKLREVREQAAKAAVASVPLSPIQQDHEGSSAATVASSSKAGAAAGTSGEPGSPMLVDTSRVSVSGAMQTARDTVFFGDDDDDVVYNAGQAGKPKSEKVDIDTLMEVLYRIARSDRESRILADLNVDFNALEKKDPNARASIMSQIERERALAQSDAVSEASVDSKRFSFSALLDVLNDAAGSDDEDADVDPDTLANTLLNSYNIGVAVPPESAATTSSALGGASKPAPASHSGFTPLPYPSALGAQPQPPTGPSPYGSHVQQDELRPMSTLSDLDRLESMLNKEEEMLRKMRS